MDPVTPKPSYFTTELRLVANEPTRGPQDCMSFGVIAAPYIDRIKVSYDQGGYGELPVGFSLLTPIPTPIYFLSTVTQTITIALAIDCELKDTRSGKVDANGNLQTQLGNSPLQTFSLIGSSVAPGVPTLIAGLYGSSKTIRIRQIVLWADFGYNVQLSRFTGAPAVTGAIVPWETNDVATASRSIDQAAGFVQGATLLTLPNGAGGFPNSLQFGEGLKCPTILPGQGIGIFTDGAGGGTTFFANLVFTEE